MGDQILQLFHWAWWCSLHTHITLHNVALHYSVWPFSSWQLILTVQDFPLPDAARPRFGDSRVSLEPLLVHGYHLQTVPSTLYPIYDTNQYSIHSTRLSWANSTQYPIYGTNHRSMERSYHSQALPTGYYPVPNIWYQPVLNSTQLTIMARQTCFQWGSKGRQTKRPLQFFREPL